MNCKVRLSHIKLGVALGVIFSFAIPAIAQRINIHPKPRWESSLRKFGFKDSNPHEVAMTNDAVGIAFVAHNPDALNPANAIGENSFVVHVVTFGSSTGKVLAHKEWVVSELEFFFGSTAGNRFVLMLERHKINGGPWPATLLWLAPDLQEIRRVELPSSVGEGSWTMAVSATGQSMLLSHGPDKQTTHQLVNVDTLEQRSSWTDDVTIMGSAISETLAVAWGVTANRHGAWVAASGFSAEWKPLKDFQDWTPALPFGESGVIGTGRGGSTVLVESSASEKLFSHSLSRVPATPNLRIITTSADGKKAAFSVAAEHNRWPHPRRNFIYVYQPPVTDPVFVTTIPKIDVYAPASVFAPDAAALAVVGGHSVRLFDLRNSP